MSLTTIIGKKVGLYVQKEDGSDDYTRVLCADSIAINVNTEALATDCQTEEDDDSATGSVTFSESEPGQVSWDASTEMTVREARDADAAKNVTAENMLDYQLAGRKFKLRYQIGSSATAAIYEGKVWISKNGFSGANKDQVKASVAFTGTGPLKKVQPAVVAPGT